ncbi:SMI1/KNR4 family protein [Saccharibacillus alkalitolerans]|uniref:SMI1/KNR4 family protein n=1 Tax=Saccharibacillus alkalitolerans TaxID=2705290 RepID=A0ABX0FCZ2_9BACL|nr:SMI1/KNR4 family protein [Saccharibacillus alkalitolerans]NGZ77276.1 SMI1/KNR4 family protein [Saccharibacillus alkalitolerans]
MNEREAENAGGTEGTAGRESARLDAEIEDIRRRIDERCGNERFRMLFYDVAGNIPADMLDGEREVPEELADEDDGEWKFWKPVPSTITDREIGESESRLGAEFPPSFRAALQAYHLVSWTSAGVEDGRGGYVGGCMSFTLPALTTELRLSELERNAAEDWGHLIAAGYLPFAIGEDGQGPICFDLERRREDGDCPVVWMLHDYLVDLGPEGAGVRANVEPHMRQLADSFGEMKAVLFGGEKEQE